MTELAVWYSYCTLYGRDMKKNENNLKKSLTFSYFLRKLRGNK